MTFTALINVMPLKELLDPRGKAVQGGLQNLGLGAIDDVRIGKHLTLQIKAKDKAAAQALAEEACNKLLANPVMENFDIQITEA